MIPCKDCLDRYVGCHSTCDKYIEWNKQHLEQKKIISASRQKDKEINMFERDRKRKCARRRDGK